MSRYFRFVDMRFASLYRVIWVVVLTLYSIHLILLLFYLADELSVNN